MRLLMRFQEEGWVPALPLVINAETRWAAANVSAFAALGSSSVSITAVSQAGISAGVQRIPQCHTQHGVRTSAPCPWCFTHRDSTDHQSLWRCHPEPGTFMDVRYNQCNTFSPASLLCSNPFGNLLQRTFLQAMAFYSAEVANSDVSPLSPLCHEPPGTCETFFSHADLHTPKAPLAKPSQSLVRLSQPLF